VAGGVEGCERDVRPKEIQLKAVAGADEPANAETMDVVLRPLPLVRATIITSLGNNKHK